MNQSQCTLASPVVIEGVGLFFGKPVRVRCLPAEANTGVTFVRTDLPDAPAIPVRPEYVVGPQRWTALKNGAAEVSLIEHILAALCGMGISNLVIETDASEMPVGDGSAQTFTRAFQKAGIRALDAPRRQLRLPHPVAIVDKDVALVAIPQDEGLTVTYVLDYGKRFLRCQTLTQQIDKDSFLRDIAPARTYVLRTEVDAFIKQGLGRGATPENTIAVEEDGTTVSTPRFPDECVRHKILDLIGDLFLANGQISARIIGYKSGHATNVRLAKAVSEACEQSSPAGK